MIYPLILYYSITPKPTLCLSTVQTLAVVVPVPWSLPARYQGARSAGREMIETAKNQRMLRHSGL